MSKTTSKGQAAAAGEQVNQAELPVVPNHGGVYLVHGGTVTTLAGGPPADTPAAAVPEAAPQRTGEEA